MKHLKLTSLVAAFALACALALAGCGGGSGSAAGAPASKEALTGYWTNEVPTAASASAASASASASAESASAEGGDELLADSGEPTALVYAYLDLEEDGTAMLVMDGFMYEGTWKVENNAASLELEGITPVSLGMNGDKLVLSQEGLQITLTKTDEQQDLTGSETIMDDTEYVEPVVEDVEAKTIADDDKVTITVTGKGTDFTGDPGFRVSITNKGAKDIYVETADVFKVGDKDVEAGMGEIIEAGQTYDDAFLYFPADELGGGVELLNGVSGQLVVTDDETEEEIATYDFSM